MSNCGNAYNRNDLLPRSPPTPLTNGMASESAGPCLVESGQRCCCWAWHCCSASLWGLVLQGFRGEPGRCHPIGCPMSLQPPSNTPLNQHSIRALEDWLISLNAERIDGDPCRWALTRPDWSADILLAREDVVVIWQQPGAEESRCSLPYGLSRADVTAAIQAGP